MRIWGTRLTRSLTSHNSGVRSTPCSRHQHSLLSSTGKQSLGYTTIARPRSIVWEAAVGYAVPIHNTTIRSSRIRMGLTRTARRDHHAGAPRFVNDDRSTHLPSHLILLDLIVGSTINQTSNLWVIVEFFQELCRFEVISDLGEF